jgi:hypothetical protein
VVLRRSDQALSPTVTVEEALRRLEDRAALLRYLAESASGNPDRPNDAVLSGLGDALEDIVEIARAARQTLSVDSLSTELKKTTTRRR